jgi:hypothetical protein
LVEAKDTHIKTRNGLLRDSSGFVTYSEAHRRKAEIDSTLIAQILNEGVPGGGHAWTPKKLERVFKDRTGRRGIWSHYEVPVKHFLSLFPKTFEQFGHDMQFVRLRHMMRPQLLDSTEDAMIRLARARQHGYIEQHPHIEGTVELHNEELHELFDAIAEGRDGACLKEITEKSRTQMPSLPELRNNRMKAAFKHHQPISSQAKPTQTVLKPISSQAVQFSG